MINYESLLLRPPASIRKANALNCRWSQLTLAFVNIIRRESNQWDFSVAFIKRRSLLICLVSCCSLSFICWTDFSSHTWTTHACCTLPPVPHPLLYILRLSVSKEEKIEQTSDFFETLPYFQLHKHTRTQHLKPKMWKSNQKTEIVNL